MAADVLATQGTRASTAMVLTTLFQNILPSSTHWGLTHYGWIYTPRNEVRGVYWIHPVCPSVCPSVCLSVYPLTFRVRPVASTVQDGFFPYLVQIINSMRGCIACDDPWLWPISSRSFGLDLENRVRSVASTVLDGFFFCTVLNCLFKSWLYTRL